MSSSTEPRGSTRAPPMPQREAQQLDDSVKGEGYTKGTIPQTPSKPILSLRLRLEKKNFYIGTIQ
eukprot:478280-Amphidinium_carterae.1